MTTAHRRAQCPHCKRMCEQRRTTVPVGGLAVPAWECNECGVTYADESEATVDNVTVEEPIPVFACPLCKSEAVTRLTVRDPRGLALPATDCVDCELICLSQPVATDHERVESERNLALEAKCGLLSISLRQGDARVLDLEAQLAESQGVREALTAQLRLCERKADSLRPTPDGTPCKHCGEARLTKQHFLAGGGHSFEAAP